MRRQVGKVGALGAALVLLAAACGSDSGSSSSDTTDASGGTAAGGDPVKLAFLWEVSGESAVAIDDLQNGAELALADLNAANGIDGREVVAERFSANPLDPEQTATAVLSAGDYEPAAMVGLLVSSQAAAAVSQVDRVGIPTVVVAQPDPTLVYGGEFSSDLMWSVQPYMPNVVTALVDHMVDEDGLTEIGLMGTNESFGQTGVESAKTAMAAKDLQPVAERLYAPDADDFSEAAVAMADAQAVLNWGYPNPLAAQIKQFAEGGLDIPTYDGPSAPIVAGFQMAPPEALAQLKATIPCDPGDPQSSALSDMVAAYQEKYGMAPSYSAVSAYDAVMVAAAAVSEAGSTDPDAVNEALGTVEVDGACGAYAADDGHVMFHASEIVEFAADGSSTVLASYDLPQTPEGG